MIVIVVMNPDATEKSAMDAAIVTNAVIVIAVRNAGMLLAHVPTVSVRESNVPEVAESVRHADSVTVVTRVRADVTVSCAMIAELVTDAMTRAVVHKTTM